MGDFALVGVLLVAVFALVGGALVAWGIARIVARVRHARLRESRGATVTGVVTDVVWRGSSTRHQQGYPVVTFTDHRGVEREAVGTTGTDGPPLPGKKLGVWYDPLDESVEPVVTGDWRATFMTVLVLAVGGFFLVFGIAGIASGVAALVE
jgi:hypothetical protein